MNGAEFIKAVEQIEKEKGIDRNIIFEAMENALMAAYKKNSGSLQNSKVVIDKVTGDIKVYSFLTVISDEMTELEEEEEEEFDEERELTEEEKELKKEEAKRVRLTIDTTITLTEARKQNKLLNIGDTIDTEITPKEDFGRVATSTAKQVLIQKIREAERSSILADLGDKQDELLIGTVELEDTDNFYINLGRSNGILPKKECIPGERINMGSQLKVYVSKVDANPKGLLVLLSRTHYGFLKRLFELEIPEINDGSIMVYSVARDAGNRSKVAVYSEKSNIDPIGSCIGERGSRISRILAELNGEKVDVIKYDSEPEVFIENALSPAKNLKVLIMDPKKQEALVVADSDNFSLAIGKKGSNARLASRLTKYKIDIKNMEQASELGINFRAE